MNNSNNQLHIYTRVSSTVQSEEGSSLETQQQDGLKQAEQLGFEPVIWNEGGQSSSHDDLENRPVLAELLDKIELGQVKHLFVYNTDRLSRNQNTWSFIRWKLQQNDVVLYTPTGKIEVSNPMENLLMGMLSEISQYDNIMRSERSRRGKLFRVQQGFYHGGPSPFGYEVRNKKLIENPEESRWVVDMFNFYSEGWSVSDIRKYLNQNGVVPRRGKPRWSLGSINKILRNTLYIGWYDYTDKKLKETVRVEVTGFIDPVIFDKVQKRIDRFLERKHQVNRSKHEYLLRDFMVCGHCGQKMSGRIGPNNQCYYCPKKERNWVTGENPGTKWQRGKGCSMTRSLNIEKSDRLVWDSVMEIVKSSKLMREQERQSLMDGVIENREKTMNKLDRLKKKKRLLETEFSELRVGVEDLWMSDQIDIDLELDDLKSTMRLQGVSIMAELMKIQKLEEELKVDTRWVDWLWEFENKVNGLDKLSTIEKKRFLETIIESIKVFYDPVSITHSLEIEFNVPIVHDYLDYNDQNFKADGWKIGDGFKTYTMDGITINKGGRPSKDTEKDLDHEPYEVIRESTDTLPSDLTVKTDDSPVDKYGI